MELEILWSQLQIMELMKNQWNEWKINLIERNKLKILENTRHEGYKQCQKS